MGLLLDRHAIEDFDDIGPRNSGQRLIAQDRFYVEPQALFNDSAPSLGITGFSEAICIVGKGKIDSLTTPLLLRVTWIDSLSHQNLKALRFCSGRDRRPGRVVAPDCITTRLRFSATHPLLPDVGVRQ